MHLIFNRVKTQPEKNVIQKKHPIVPESALIPSIRLKALIITIIVSIDNGTPMKSGIMFMPKIPYKLVSCIFAKYTKINAIIVIPYFN